MSFDSLIKKERIKNIYAYKELKDGESIEFGWEEASDLDDDFYIVSYSSSSKKTSIKDKEWSKKEGKNIATVSDYNKFFLALTGYSPAEFIEEWGSASKKADLEEYWKGRSLKYRDKEGSFILNLANILIDPNSKGFSMYGRIFRKISI